MEPKIFSAKEFLELIYSNNSKQLDVVTNQLTTGAQVFLITRFKAELDDANEVVQVSFAKFFEMLTDGKLDDVENLFAYLIRVVRNDYGRYMLQKNKSQPLDTEGELLNTPFAVKEIFIDREYFMRECLKELAPKQVKFIDQIFEYAELNDYQAAEVIGISYSAFRTKKSRLLHILTECVTQKMEINNNKK